MTAKLLRNLLLAVAIAVPAAIVVPAGTASATTLAPLSLEQLTDASEYVIHGMVTEVWTEIDDAGLVWTRARVDVAETLKGPDSPNELIIDSLGGDYEGYVLKVPSRARYSVHEELYTFLTRTDDGRLIPVAKFLGKFIVRRAPGDTESYLRTWHGSDKGIAYDGRFLPHPKSDDRLYMNDFLERVQARLDTGWDGKAIPGMATDRLPALNTPDRRKQ